MWELAGTAAGTHNAHEASAEAMTENSIARSLDSTSLRDCTPFRGLARAQERVGHSVSCGWTTSLRPLTWLLRSLSKPTGTALNPPVSTSYGVG